MEPTIDALAYQGLKERKKAEVIARLRIMPALSSEITWVLIKDGGEYFVRRFSYVKHGPVEKLSLALIGSEAIIEKDIAEKMVSQVQQIEIKPFAIESGFGVDGVFYEFEFSRFIGSTLLRWWKGQQPQWRVLENWFNETIVHFQSKLPAPSPYDKRG